MFEEIPKVEFTVKEKGATVYRDAIVYGSVAELLADSKEDREAKFQARYDQWKATVAQMSVQQEETEAEVS